MWYRVRWAKSQGTAYRMRALLFGLALLTTGPLPLALAQSMGNYCSVPPSVSTSIQPNVLVVLDNSGSMNYTAYAGSYDPSQFTKGYYGYFDPTQNYKYNGSHWEVTANPISDGTVTNPIASGDFLNWATMRRLDVAKKLLIGGKAAPRSPQGAVTVKLLGEDASASWNFSKTHDNTGDPDLISNFVGNYSYDMSGDELVIRPATSITDTALVYPENNLSPPAAWTATGAPSAWDAVNEVAADADATYIQNQKDTSKILFGSTGINPCSGSILPSFCSGSIQSITVKIRAKKVGLGTRKIAATLQISGLQYDSAHNSLSTKYTDYSPAQWIVNPATSNPWQWSDLGNLQGFGVFGPTTPSSTKYVRVTQVYLEIAVTSSIGGPYRTIVDQGNVKAEGILDHLGDSVRFGLAYYNYGYGYEKSPPTTNGKDDGGHIDKGIDFGATTDMITSVSNMTPSTWTPLAETLYEMIHYFRQDAPVYQNSPADFKVSQNDDPYYYRYTKLAGSSLSDQYVPCAKSFILLMTDGDSTADQNIPALLKNFDGDQNETTRTYSNSGSDYLDDVALWGRTVDHRSAAEGTQDLAGIQNVVLYNVYLFGKAGALLQDASINGGFNDLNGDNRPGPDLSEYLRETDGDGTLTLGEDLPSTYFEGEDGYELEDAIVNAIASILSRAASGTAVSVLTTASRDVGSLLQAYFLPVAQDGVRQVKWTGYMQNLWVDDDQNLREDTVSDKQLELDKDNVMKLFFNEAAGESEVGLFTTDAAGDGGTLGSCGPATTKPFAQLTPVFEAGKQLAQRLPSERQIFTANTVRHGATQIVTGCTSPNCFTTGSIGSGSTLEQALNAEAAPSFYTSENIIRYVRGECLETGVTGDTPCGATANTNVRDRRLPVDGVQQVWKLGDVINATPKTLANVPVNRYHHEYGDITYYRYATSDTYKKRSAMTFVGANDGMLHALRLGYLKTGSGTIKAWYKNLFSSADADRDRVGEEAWGYIPFNAFPYLKYLADPTYCHIYFNDLPVRIVDASLEGGPTATKTDASWRSILIGGMRFGGACEGGTPTPPIAGVGFSSYYAIDVTDAENPVPLWEFSDPDMGYATTAPAIMRTGTKDVNGNWYVAVGSGSTQLPKTLTDIARNKAGAIYILNLKTGEMVQKISLAHDAIVGGLLSVDSDRDYHSEKLYWGTSYNEIGTWKGEMMSLSIPNDDLSAGSFVPTVLFAGDYPFTATPEAARYDADVWVYAGSGKYYSDVDDIDTKDQIFIGMKDPPTKTPLELSDMDNRTTPDEANAVVTGKVLSAKQACIYDSATNGFTQKTIVTEITPTSTAVTPSVAGWYIALKSGERVVTRPISVGGLVDFLTYKPSRNICDYGGDAYAYAVGYSTGVAPTVIALRSPDITDKSGVGDDVTVNNRVLLGHGAPPAGEGIILLPQKDGEKVLKQKIQLGTTAIMEGEIRPPIDLSTTIIHWLKR